MKKMLIAGNWKMHKTSKEAEEFFKALSRKVKNNYPDVFIAVPFTALQISVNANDNEKIFIGAQNMHDMEEGAFTGEVSVDMLLDVGAKFVILGHSERRHIFLETDDFINKKLVRALEEGIQPIFCIGEKEEAREEGKTKEVLEKQLSLGLANISKEAIKKIIIAYEPVWAIGTGKTATPEIAQETHQFIRKYLEENYGKEVSQDIFILYGGSVKPENAKNLMEKEDINGALVGGASLKVDVFDTIIQNSMKIG